ncbi:MAG: SH3 domain-containing protein [Treponema sp.]
MERKKRKHQARKWIRLLIIVLLFFSYSIIFADPSIINIEYFPKVARPADVFTIRFYMNTRLTSTPKIELNDDGFLSLETSSMFIEHSNTVIENQYKIRKTGLVKLENILLYIEEYIIKVPTIELEVQANPLSKDTQFRVRVFKNTETDDIAKKNMYEYDIKNSFIVGKEYFILIEGLFQKTNEQHISVQYDLPTNAFIEKLKTFPLEFMQDETWNSISMFLWIPLKEGLQPLPKFNLNLDLSRTQEYKLTLEKLEVNVLPPEKKVPLKDQSKEDFHNALNKILDEKKTVKQYTEKEVGIAKKIKLLREKERASFFQIKLQKERVKLEKELDLENSFSTFNYKIYILSILIAIIFLIGPIFIKIIKQKSFNFYSILSFCIGILILIYTINTSDLREEYTFTDYIEYNNIYISPDISSTVLENINIGETVKIVYTSKDWIFIETRNNIRGWMQRRGKE